MVAATLTAAGILSIFLPAYQVRIHVRWAPEVVEADREALERHFRLEDARRIKGSTWSYSLADSSRANIRALVQEQRVEDTANLHRTRFRPTFAVDRLRQVWFFALVAGAVAATLVLAGLIAGNRGRAMYSRISAMLAGERAAWCAAALVASGAFVFRFLTLRDFTNDHYMHLAWAQQLLLGAVPSRDFVDPGYPLTYTLSALVQLLWPAPLSEAVLSIAMLSVAAALTLVVTRAVTGSLAVATVAAIACILLQPRLYNYPKLLAPVVALWLLARCQRGPSCWRLAALAGWTTISFLLRHDLGLYVAVAVAAGLLVGSDGTPRIRVRRTATYVTFGFLMVMPYLIYVQWAEGLAENIRDALEFLRAENPPMSLVATPPFPFLTTLSIWQWNEIDSLATLFYFGRLFVPLAIAIFLARRDRLQRSTSAVLVTAIVLLATYAAMIMRDPLVTRIPDIAVPVSVVGAWICWSLAHVRAAGTPYRWFVRAVAGTAVALIAVASLGSVWVMSSAAERIRETRLLEGRHAVIGHVRTLAARFNSWSGQVWPHGAQPQVVEYVQACTAPSDHLLITWDAPEYYFFARRPFAAGHALLFGFSSTRDQASMLSRMHEQRVPIVLVKRNDHVEFARRYPLLDSYLQREYRVVGHYDVRADLQLAIAVKSDLPSTSSYGPGWPCGFAETGGARQASSDVQ